MYTYMSRDGHLKRPERGRATASFPTTFEVRGRPQGSPPHFRSSPAPTMTTRTAPTPFMVRAGVVGWRSRDPCGRPGPLTPLVCERIQKVSEKEERYTL